MFSSGEHKITTIDVNIEKYTFLQPQRRGHICRENKQIALQ